MDELQSGMFENKVYVDLEIEVERNKPLFLEKLRENIIKPLLIFNCISCIM